MVCGSIDGYPEDPACSNLGTEQMASQKTVIIVLVVSLTDQCHLSCFVSLCGECCRCCSLCLALMKRNVQLHHHIVISVLAMLKKIRRRGSLKNWCLVQIVDVQVGLLLSLKGGEEVGHENSRPTQ